MKAFKRTTEIPNNNSDEAKRSDEGLTNESTL